jgi:hypothetical protein
VGFANGDFGVLNDPVESFLGRIAEQLFGESDVFLGGEAEAVEDFFNFDFGYFDLLGNFDLLLAGQELYLAHFLQIHAHWIIERFDRGILGLFLIFRAQFDANGRRGNDFNFQTAKAAMNFVEFLLAVFVGRETFVEVVASEVALLLGQLDQFFDLFAERGAEVAAGRFAGRIDPRSECDRRTGMALRGSSTVIGMEFWTGGSGRRLQVQKRARFNTHADSGFIGCLASDLWEEIALKAATLVGNAGGLDRAVEAENMSRRDAIFFLDAKDGRGCRDRQEKRR